MGDQLPKRGWLKYVSLPRRTEAEFLNVKKGESQILDREKTRSKSGLELIVFV